MTNEEAFTLLNDIRKDGQQDDGGKQIGVIRPLDQIKALIDAGMTAPAAYEAHRAWTLARMRNG